MYIYGSCNLILLLPCDDNKMTADPSTSTSEKVTRFVSPGQCDNKHFRIVCNANSKKNNWKIKQKIFKNVLHKNDIK